MNRRKVLKRILSGSLDVRFEQMCNLVEGFGFRLARARGSHHIFVHPGIPDLLNLQEVQGKAKPYQIRQFMRLIERYNIQLEGD